MSTSDNQSMRVCQKSPDTIPPGSVWVKHIIHYSNRSPHIHIQSTFQFQRIGSFWELLIPWGTRNSRIPGYLIRGVTARNCLQEVFTCRTCSSVIRLWFSLSAVAIRIEPTIWSVRYRIRANLRLLSKICCFPFPISCLSSASLLPLPTVVYLVHILFPDISCTSVALFGGIETG